MMDLVVTTDTALLDRFMTGLKGELAVAVQDSAALLRPIAEANIDALDINDTYALRESLYISVYGGSQYGESVSNASEAYQFNPTKYPTIRELNGGNLDVDPEVKSYGPSIGYLAVAASHGKAVEEGYVSLYGNDVPARPFIELTANEAFPAVVGEFEKALVRLLR